MTFNKNPPKEQEDLNNSNTHNIYMAVKRKIRGKYCEVRERNTSAGKKGSIIRKWSPPKEEDSPKWIIRKKVLKKLFE